MTSDPPDRMVSPGKAIHWFNPENDLALASGLTNYTPPKAAIAIRNAGECLPLWYGEDSDLVICSGGDQTWLDRTTRNFNLHTVATHAWQDNPGLRPRPWGWSAYARRYFERLGFAADLLPGDGRIEKMRMLSHRRTASVLAGELKKMLPDERLASAAVECRTIDDLTVFLISQPDAYLKSPWSSSGRGVIRTSALPREKVLRFALDSIRRQGSVMAEPAYRKTIDFAMLFECRGGHTSYAATSVFLTDTHGAYIGNLLAPEGQRIATVGRWIDAVRLERVRDSLLRLIDLTIAPHYDGVLGIDMLACADGMLDAAVELNLRTTMGYVAARFADRHIYPESRGVMRCVPGRTASRCRENYVTEEGKLAKGVLHMSPPTPTFTFIAEVK